MREILTVTSGDFRIAFCTFITVLLVLLYDTLLLAAEATETCRRIVIYDKIQGEHENTP